MTSIRMEPVWITLGHSVGIAAAHALNQNVAVQAIDYPRYHQALLDAGQVLEPTEARRIEWTSQAEWDKAKPGYEWLFTAINKDRDGKVSSGEYKEFQAFKQKHSDWHARLKAELGNK